MNYKEGVSPDNSTNTMIFKQLPGSNGQTPHGNESTLPLFGQGDSPILKSEKRLSDIKPREKLQKGAILLPVFDNQQKENSISDKIQLLDDNIKRIGSENLILKSELSKMIASVVRERKDIEEARNKPKLANRPKSKLEKKSENLQLSIDIPIKGRISLPAFQGTSKREDSLPLEAKIVPPKKNFKISRPLQLETNLITSGSEGHSGEVRQRLFHPTQPLSVKGSARNPIREGFLSSARSFERATSGERPNSSHILIRKLSDQGHEYFANLTFNSSRIVPTSVDNQGYKDNKEQMFKVSRNFGVKKQIRQSRGGSTSTGIESSLQTEKLESTQRITAAEAKSEFVETMPMLLNSVLTKVENVFKKYEECEKAMLAKNQALLKMLDEKLKAREEKNRK